MGIKPVFMGIRPDNNSVALTFNKQVRAYNNWLANIAAAGQIIVVDTWARLADWTSTTGGALGFTLQDNLHLSGSGAIRDGHALAAALSPFLPAVNTTTRSPADAYDATYNPYGTKGPVNSSIPAGLFQAAQGPVTLTTAGTGYQIGSEYVWAEQNGAGTQACTAAIAARTDKFPDGSVAPGYEVVLTIAAGTGQKLVGVQLNNFVNTGNLYYDGSNYSGAGGGLTSGWYQPGDLLQMSCEYAIDAGGATAGVVYYMPRVAVTQNNFPGGVVSLITAITAGNPTAITVNSQHPSNPITGAVRLNNIAGSGTLASVLNGNSFTATPTGGSVGAWTFTVPATTTGAYTGSGIVQQNNNSQVGSSFAGQTIPAGGALDVAGISGVLVTPVFQVMQTGAAGDYQSSPSLGPGYLAPGFQWGFSQAPHPAR